MVYGPHCAQSQTLLVQENPELVSLDNSNHSDSGCALADAQLVASPLPSVAPAIIFEVWSYVTQNDPEPTIFTFQVLGFQVCTGQPSLGYTLLNLPAPTSQINSQAYRVRLPPASPCSQQSSSAPSSGLKQPSHSSRPTQARAQRSWPLLRLQQTPATPCPSSGGSQEQGPAPSAGPSVQIPSSSRMGVRPGFCVECS